MCIYCLFLTPNIKFKFFNGNIFISKIFIFANMNFKITIYLLRQLLIKPWHSNLTATPISILVQPFPSHQSWGNLVTCNLSYVIFITFQVKSNITKLLFSQVICNLIILLSEVILLFVYSSCVKLLFS